VKKNAGQAQDSDLDEEKWSGFGHDVAGMGGEAGAFELNGDVVYGESVVQLRGWRRGWLRIRPCACQGRGHGQQSD